MANIYQSVIEELLQPAGVTINRNDPAGITVHDDRFYRRVLLDGSLGLGESYIDGWWDSDAPDEFLYRLINSNIEEQLKTNVKIWWQILKARMFNLQGRLQSERDIKLHYNTGNDLFERMLDKYMIYSCGYWANASDLDEAQEHKLDLICRKLKLAPGQQVLDIGCGWGGLAQYAAEKYGVFVTGITLSAEQERVAIQRCRGLSVKILLQDYRDLHGRFDRIVSVGMFEHVGYRNYDRFMSVVQQCLKNDGLFLLHCIGSNESRVTTDAWINRYIFPGGMMPSVAQIGRAIEKKFIIQDWHNFGHDYDYTLMAWLRNFKAAWYQIKDRYGDRFYRMWVYYLCLSAASFRANKNNLWQIVLTKPGYSEVYQSVR
ncbi:MAG: cyclopropane-fatty-acyl-phospholipid synthase [Mucilaginibacter sp.]|nr:cyclopropane-fatty-acyl-phospholipid synthase [Mucilaginibacter sp.]